MTSTTYSPYGTATTTGTPSSSIGFAGSYALPNSGGLDDMRARDYNPATGAFTSVDPALAITGQPYLYASDAPSYLTDPAGLCSWFNVWCEATQHWRGLAQTAVITAGIVGSAFCIAATAGGCLGFTPFIGAAISAATYAIGGGGPASGYLHAATEGFIIGSASMYCALGACGAFLAAAGVDIGIGAAFGVNDYLSATACPSIGGSVESALIGSVENAPYPVDKLFGGGD